MRFMRVLTDPAIRLLALPKAALIIGFGHRAKPGEHADWRELEAQEFSTSCPS
jgi:hypothetical protein